MIAHRVYCETDTGVRAAAPANDETHGEMIAQAVLGTERRGGIICLAHVQKSIDGGEWVTVAEWEY